MATSNEHSLKLVVVIVETWLLIKVATLSSCLCFQLLIHLGLGLAGSDLLLDLFPLILVYDRLVAARRLALQQALFEHSLDLGLDFPLLRKLLVHLVHLLGHVVEGGQLGRDLSLLLLLVSLVVLDLGLGPPALG